MIVPAGNRPGFHLLAILFCCLTWQLQAALDPVDGYPLTGTYTLSVDGGGGDGTYTVEVQKPADDATVHQALLMAATTENRILSTGDISLQQTPIAWDQQVTNDFHRNYLADVTSLLKSSLDAANAGTTTYTIQEAVDSATINGTVLVIVWNDPTVSASHTVMLVFGGLATAGDTLNITLASAIPFNGRADFGLGIAHSLQGGDQQATQVTVNGSRLTSAAGGQDDGAGSKGALITVGGIGDSTDNPDDPFALPGNNFRYDDELYSLLPLLSPTTTSLAINTVNPSQDDNLFFAHLLVTGSAFVGEGIAVAPDSAARLFGASHTLTATVMSSDGLPAAGVPVIFDITAGPNAGLGSTPIYTDAAGLASWTYTDSAQSAGTDTIEAWFLNADNDLFTSTPATVTWQEVIEGPTQLIDLCQQWNLIFLKMDPEIDNPELLFGDDTFTYRLVKEKADGGEYDYAYSYQLLTGPGSLTGGQTYWVYAPTARQIEIGGVLNATTTQLLTKAWNLTGVHENSALPATAAILRIVGWDCATQTYQVPTRDQLGRYLLDGGSGYFVFAARAVNVLVRE